jgi:hypothetical protein
VTQRVDLDRLADYAAGLLDGTPEAAEVAGLIATEPDWAQAYTLLAEADRAVLAELADLGAEPLVMPVDVVARLDACLAGVAGGSIGDERPRLTVITGEGTGPTRSATRAAARAKRRRTAWIAAVAAGVLAFGGFGVTALSDMVGSKSESPAGMSSGRGANEAGDALGGQPAVPPAGAPELGPPTMLSTGTNYFAADLGASFRGFVPGPEQPGRVTTSRDQVNTAQVAPPLRRLVDVVALSTCLRLVSSTYGGQPTVVDFARYEDDPALIVLLADATGRPARVVVAGTSCGLPEHGADVRYTTAVS